MADISDVEQAVAGAVTSILYPEGSSQSSILGILCRIYRGWPNSATLNADLSGGIVNVTVATDNDPGRVTTRYLPEWKTAASQPGMAADVSGSTVTITGTPLAGDIVGILIDHEAWAYRIRTGDTPSLVASNLNQLLPKNLLASVQGTTITVAGAPSILVRVVCDKATSFESRRQEKDLRIICWCPTPPVRDAVAAAIDSAINQMSFLPLPDGTSGRITYRNTAGYDQAQNALLYRRDLVYTIEYPTVTIIQQPSMLFGGSEINGNITYG